MQCYYCGYSNAHVVGCPSFPGGHNDVEEWKRGYSDGQNGNTADPNGNATYTLGYGRSEIAVRERELVEKFMLLLSANNFCLSSPKVIEFFGEHKYNKEFVELVRISLTNCLAGPGC